MNDLACWKTELLYKTMLSHERFMPVLGIDENVEIPGAEKDVVKYCREKSYDFVVLDSNQTLVEQENPDIIIYQKPYDNKYPVHHRITKNWKALSVYMLYGFHSVEEDWQFDQQIMLRSWQYYYENDMAVGNAKKRMRNHGRNIRVTGTPMMDELMETNGYSKNPWKNKDSRKRIIYAPHATIQNAMTGVLYSTFLIYGELMLKIAKEMSSQVCFAFKPHPNLYKNLLKCWGKDKTDAYYREWDELENGQLELGKYKDLFHYSDAMIHDCASFTMEYLYTLNPVMYLIRESEEVHTKNLNPFGKMSFNLHYKGKSEYDIRRFIQDVITGEDPLRADREQFYKSALVPPHGKSACGNIINAILDNKRI